MKMNTLQLQLNMERQQRSIEMVERKVEVKADELFGKFERGINEEVSDLKLQLKQLNDKCDKMLEWQTEIQKNQGQLASRQDLLFNKQDQIQSTLAEDLPTPHGASVLSWPNASPSIANTPAHPSNFNAPLYGSGMPGPSAPQYQPPVVIPDVSSYLSDADLESILTFDWEPLNDRVEQVESAHRDKPNRNNPQGVKGPNKNDSHGVKGPIKQGESPRDLVNDQPPQLIDPSIVIQNNQNLCTEDDVGKLAVLLARESFFGENILLQSTIKGKGKKGNSALEGSKLSSLVSTIHGTAVFQGMSREDFSNNIKPKIVKAIQHHCKYLRTKKQ